MQTGTDCTELSATCHANCGFQLAGHEWEITVPKWEETAI